MSASIGDLSAPRNDDAAALARHLEHQLVHSAHEPGRILELPAFGEKRLVEQEVAPVGEARLFLVQALHHRMRRIDLEDRLGLGRFLPNGLQDAREISPHVVLVCDQARRRLREARGDAHVLPPVADRVLQSPDEGPVPARLLRFLFLLVVGLELGEIELALRDRGERPALVFGKIRDQPLVDAFRQEQHLDPALAKDFQVRAVFRGEERLRGDVVDLVLSFLHARDVVRERYALLFAVGLGGGKTQELCDPLAAGEVLAHPLLQDAPEFPPETRVLVLLILGEVFEQAEDALGAAGADRLDVAALLQDLARDVERQVVRVDHAAHEAQVRRQQLLGVVHDEDAPHVELEAPALVPVPQVEGRARGNVEQLHVLLPALDAVVRVGERRVRVVRHVLVELLVLLLADLRFRPRPQGARLVDRLILVGDFLRRLLLVPPHLLHHDRDRDVIGILPDDLLQLPVREQLGLALAKGQDDVGAAPFLRRRFDGVFTAPVPHVTMPAHRLAGRESRAARQERNAVGDDEGRIEAHAELPDQPRVLRLVAGERLEELARPGLGDGSDVVDDLLTRHADAVVRHREGPSLLVEGNADLEVGVGAVQGVPGKGLEAQLVGRVGGVRYQLPQEDLLVAVQGVDHEVEQLLDFGLEAQGLFGRGRRHCLSPARNSPDMGLDSRLFKTRRTAAGTSIFLNIAHFPNSLSPQGRTSMLRTVSIRAVNDKNPGGLVAHPSEAVLSAASDIVPLRFTGRAGEYFRIWIVNICLSIVTLGIYSAWAKVRRKRYFYGNTLLEDAAFEYLADPKAILKGRIVVVAAFAVYSLAGHINPLAGPLLGLVLLGFLPWLIVRALRFNAVNSAHRNVRFGFRAGYGETARLLILPVILVPLTLGLLYPYYAYRKKRFF